MADDFYTMQEVMEKLRKSEENVQDLVKQGKLRQYMDAGNPMFKTTDVDSLAEEIVGLDVSSLGIDLSGSELDLNLMETGAGEDLDLESDNLDLIETGGIEDLGGSEIELAETASIEDLASDSLDLLETGGPEKTGIEDLGASELSLEETSEIQLEPDDSPEAKASSSDEIDLKGQSSEGGFGLSQMGDLTMADTNVGTVGINILSGTEDSFKLTEDTKADTLSADAEEIDEMDSLDADANMESFGSGSGLLDLSLQADDTSLGAVLDDILPTGADEAGGGDLPVDQIGLADETEDLLTEPSAEAEPATEQPMTAAASAAAPAQQMFAVAQVDPRTNLFGIAMFLPLTAIIIVGIILTGAMRGVTPSLMKMLTETKIAEVGLFWYVLGGLGIFAILFSLFASLGGGGGTATRKTKTKKDKKSKKSKAPKAKKEKKSKKKKK